MNLTKKKIGKNIRVRVKDIKLNQKKKHTIYDIKSVLFVEHTAFS